MLSLSQQRIDDVTFEGLTEEEMFTCVICEQRFEVKHEDKYELIGKLSGRNESQNIHICLCEHCACDIGKIGDD